MDYPPAYQTMSQLADDLSYIMSSPDGATCKELGVMVYPGNYIIDDQFSFDGNQNSYSLIFNTSADYVRIIFTFKDQSNLRFQNFAHLRIQSVSLEFHTQSMNSFTITDPSEVIITNMDTSESQPNLEGSQMRIRSVNKLIIDSMKINSLLSPIFLEINGHYATIGLINITNLIIEYAVTEECQDLRPTYSGLGALFVHFSSVLTITNLSVISPRDSTTNLPIRTSFLGQILQIFNSIDVSIRGFYARELDSYYYGYWGKIHNIAKLTLGNINFTQNTLQSSQLYSMFDIQNVNDTSIQDVEISHNSIQPEEKSDTICFFKFTMPNVRYGKIVMKDLLFTNMSQAKLLLAVGEFLDFNISNAAFTKLTIRQYNNLIEIETSHQNTDAFHSWFKGPLTSQSNLENILFDDISLESSELMHFEHTIKSQPILYLTPEEKVIANLNNITFSRIIAGPVAGQSDKDFYNGFARFDQVKGVIRQSTLSNSIFSHRHFIYSVEESSLIVDNLTVVNTIVEVSIISQYGRRDSTKQLYPPDEFSIT